MDEGTGPLALAGPAARQATEAWAEDAAAEAGQGGASAPPRVTVLMTVYNGLPHVMEAVESVLAQTFTAFELLVIDDASSDGSAERILACQDARIRLVRNASNVGQAESLNRGVALARGAYVARLDQDDRCASRRLERQVRILDARPEVAVVGSWMVAQGPAAHAQLWGERVEDYGTFLGLLMAGATPLCHPSVMVRSSALRRLGAYDPSYAPAEDLELWMRLALQRGTAYVIPEPLVTYRLHERQQSATRSLQQQQHARRAHRAFLRRLAAGWDAATLERLGSLLRGEPSFWDTAGSARELYRLLRRLDGLLAQAGTRLRLSAHDARAVRRVVSRELGVRAREGVLRGRPQSLAVYGHALRGGPAVWAQPSVVAYPLLFLLGPLGTARRVCERLIRRWRGLRSEARLLALRLAHKLPMPQGRG